MKKVLIIGGAGYIGSVLTQHFLKKGFKVCTLDNFVYQNQFAILPYLGDPDYSFFLGDHGNNSCLEKSAKGITDVVILSGLVGDPITKKYPIESEMINHKGLKSCIDFFRNRTLDKLVFVSTCSNYGLIKENESADEDFPLNPLSLYAKAKVNLEQYLLGQKNNTDYTGIVLRFATAFGISPRMRFDLTISEFTKELIFGNELLVFDENTWRPYCHVRDFARLIELVILSPKEKVFFEVFNVGGDTNNYTKKMIVNEIVNFIPEGKVRFGTHGSDPRNYKVSFEKVKNVLGFQPRFTVTDGIQELVDAFKIGLFADSPSNINKYGNFEIFYN